MRIVTVKYIGLSTTVDTEGKEHYDFHSTNVDNQKWMHLPLANGTGVKVSITFIKLPHEMTKRQALDYFSKHNPIEPAMQTFIDSEMAHLLKKEKIGTGKRGRPRKATVTVEVPTKTLTETEVSQKKNESLAKIMAKAEAKKKSAA